MRENVSLDAAGGDLEGLSAYLKESFPVPVNQSIALNDDARFIPRIGGSFVGMLQLMLLAAGAVLLTGTANVAVLLSVRASEATRSMALSKTLGASRARIMRSSLIESMVLGGLGAPVGVWLAYATSNVAANILPATFSVSFEPDPTVLAFACLLALTVALASGLVPALRTAHVDVNSVLKGDDRSGHARSPMRSGLVVAQVAVAAIMILGAPLTARSVATASSIPVGFDQKDRTLLSVTLGNHGYSPEEGKVFVREALDRLRGLPGVRDVSTLSSIPFLSCYSEGFRHPSRDAGAQGRKSESGRRATTRMNPFPTPSSAQQDEVQIDVTGKDQECLVGVRRFALFLRFLRGSDSNSGASTLVSEDCDHIALRAEDRI